MGSGGLGYRYYAYLDGARYKPPESPQDPMRALKLDKESNGYCPLCGYWSIATNVVINSKTGERGDKCLKCETIFEGSELTFTDSQMCKCGHRRNYHNEGFLNCETGQKVDNCQCMKYEPTNVTVTTSSKENV
jgi:hypothetical protein